MEPKKRKTLFQAPFWSHWKFLGLTKYPEKRSGQIVFWISAVVYSYVYLFFISLGLVIFSHTLFAWTGIREYITTTLFDILAKNPILIIGFILMEVYAIYTHTFRTVEIKKRSVGVKTFIIPALLLIGVYGGLKIATHTYELEPNALTVLPIAYIILLIIQFAVDSSSQ